MENFFVLIVLFYFLPTLVAGLRSKDNVGGILIVNLLTGWTFLGWFVALVMSCTSNGRKA